VGKLGRKKQALSPLSFCKTISGLRLYTLGRKYQGKSPKKAGFFAKMMLDA
jgi:hypothetical protein